MYVFGTKLLRTRNSGFSVDDTPYHGKKGSGCKNRQKILRKYGLGASLRPQTLQGCRLAINNVFSVLSIYRSLQQESLSQWRNSLVSYPVQQ